MSEYSQIQTYIRTNSENFKYVIKQFAEVLSSLELDAEYFASVKDWEQLNHLWVDGDAEEQIINNNGYQLHIRPFVTGWTPAERKELDDTWLEVSLLFLTADVVNRIGQLKEEHKSLLWIAMERFSKQFKEVGVFFTNEATDGRPWEAIISGKKRADGNLTPPYYLDIRLITVPTFLLRCLQTLMKIRFF